MNPVKVFTVAQTGFPNFIFKLPSEVGALNAGALRAAYSPTMHVDHDDGDSTISVDLIVYLEPGDYLVPAQTKQFFGVTVETGVTNPTTNGNCAQM